MIPSLFIFTSLITFGYILIHGLRHALAGTIPEKGEPVPLSVVYSAMAMMITGLGLLIQWVM